MAREFLRSAMRSSLTAGAEGVDPSFSSSSSCFCFLFFLVSYFLSCAERRAALSAPPAARMASIRLERSCSPPELVVLLRMGGGLRAAGAGGGGGGGGAGPGTDVATVWDFVGGGADGVEVDRVGVFSMMGVNPPSPPLRGRGVGEENRSKLSTIPV